MDIFGKDLAETVSSVLATRLSPSRWAHSLGVAETAAGLAAAHGLDPLRARMAGLLHDSAREMAPEELLATAEAHGLTIDEIERAEPLLLHGKVGAVLAREWFGLDDPELLAAVALHITGGPGMGLLAKVVFLADFVEPGRTMSAAAAARAVAFDDLSRALLIAFEAIIDYVIAGGYLLHPRTVAARNELLGTLNRMRTVARWR
ncbi:MAG: HD domain-containing protein [Firmicutes bacterium]|nr:HD domain-containing protein [Bacillota bacterium]